MAMIKRWQNMSPRERDALVADKVMGWENNKDGPVFVGAPLNQIYADSGDWKVVDCPLYTNDIPAAWEVFEKLSSNNNITINPTISLGLNGVRVALLMKDGKEIEVVAKTAPEAICLAALMVAGIDT